MISVAFANHELVIAVVDTLHDTTGKYGEFKSFVFVSLIDKDGKCTKRINQREII